MPTVRFSLGLLLAFTFTVGTASAETPDSDSVPEPGTVAERVDRAIETELQSRGVTPAGPIDDGEFLRRVSLDLTGQPPTPQQVTLFTLNPDPEKREQLVENLLQSDRFASNWGRYFRDVLFSRITEQRALIGRNTFESWINDQLASGAGWDDIATEMIIATGDVRQEGATALMLAQGADADQVAAEVSRVFLGIQIQCAQCHDHTTDRWKRTDFHELAAFFPRVRLQIQNSDGRRTFEIKSQDFSRRRVGNRSQQMAFLFRRYDKNGDDKLSREEVEGTPVGNRFAIILRVGDGDEDGMISREEAMQLPEPPGQNNGIEHRMPNLDDPSKRGTLMQPVFFLTGEQLPSGTRDQNRRAELARMITDPENEWFAKAFVNRIWGELLGEGFMMPIDDIGPDRDAHFPAAFDQLAQAFTESGYDIGWLFETVMRTRAYQRSLVSVDEPEMLANGAPTRLRADQLFESIETALNIELDQNARQGRRSNPYGNLFSSRSRFLQLFGHDPSTPQDELTGNVPQALFLMNSPLLNRQISANGPTRLAQLLKQYDNDEDVLAELYLMTLSREPSDREREVASRYITKVGDRNEAFEDLLWALLNSTEFLTRR